MSPLNSRDVTGFTLIELVVVIIISSILAGLLFMIIRGPLQAYVQVERRVVLVDVLDTALQRMTREIRLALPYSVRADSPGGMQAVEFLRTLDGGRYRDQGANRLKFNQVSGTFEVFNSMVNFSQIDLATGPTPYQECIDSTADCLVVFNIGQPADSLTAASVGTSANAYLGASGMFEGNIAAITAASANSITYDNSNLAWDFGLESPNQRFQVVDTPVSYVCNGSSIYRYSDYPIQENQPSSPGGSQSLLIDGVSSCSFDFNAPTLTRFGILSIDIEITNPQSGESVSLLQQIHITNIP